jgi:virulence-associated protein VapD
MRRRSRSALRVIARDDDRDGIALANASGSFLPNSLQWSRRVYAIAFDLDQEMLQTHYHNASYQNAYEDIRRVFSHFGFHRQQGSVYFGDESVDPVRCVLAVQEVAKNYAWFKMAVTDIRMLRIEENNDLMPAVGDYWSLLCPGI